jgi:hypothetical protein
MNSSYKKTTMKNYCFIKIVKIIVCVSIAIIGFGYLLMHLWNCLVPELFHGPVITFCQALGLLVLSKILFGGFGKMGCCGGSWNNKTHWRAKFEEKLAGMTPEEREKFKSSFRGKCGSNWGSSCEPDENKSNEH